MFLAKPGQYEACGIFTIQHFILIAITVIGIIIALKLTVNKFDVKKIIKRCTIFIWIFEIILITYKIATEGTKNVNNYVPLYYCSMLLYAGLLSSFGKGRIKRVGDVFLATGGIIGGIMFIIFPTTSCLTYPMLHLVCLHSFLFHGMMIYLGLLINFTHYIDLQKKDIVSYATLISIVCILAYIVNQIFNSNLMFISKNFKAVFIIDILYRTTGKLFTPIMILAQATLPFYVVYGIININKKYNIA